MNTVIKKQIDEMTEDELKEVLQRDYRRRLTRYRIIDAFYRKKYGMDYENFEEANIVETQGYTYEVESDAQEWELAIDGIMTVEKKLKELLGGNYCFQHQITCFACKYRQIGLPPVYLRKPDSYHRRTLFIAPEIKHSFVLHWQYTDPGYQLPSACCPFDYGSIFEAYQDLNARSYPAP